MWLFTGVLLFSFTMGCFVGASNSPVVGIFFTASLGLAGTLFSGKLIGQHTDKKINLGAFIGKSLFIISIGLVCGDLAGERYRNGFKEIVTKNFIWELNHNLTSTAEALDWIVLVEKLTKLGYSQENIRKLYLSRLTEIKNESEQSISPEEKYKYISPYNSIIDFKELALNENKNNRGPASIK